MSLLPRRLGRYELMHELARGGMGVVYLARLRSVGGFSRLVAVKQCLPEHTRDKDFVAMFLDEARLAARINHPNVVPTLDVEHSSEGLFFAMEYVEGERVVDVIRASIAKTGAVPIAIALRIVIDALHGLHAAHTLEDSDGTPLKIVHRDVSPQNIVVGYEGHTRILDFGVARAERRLTRTLIGGIPKGKLAYMAPEQLLELPLDARADVFAAGIVAWELLAGARLFDANTEALLVAQVLEMRIHGPSSRRPELPATLDAIVMKALAREAADRHESAQAFANALERCGLPVATPQIVAAFVREVLSSQREQKLALRRRIESTPALDEAAPPARSAIASPAPSVEGRASAVPAPPKTVAFDPGQSAHPAMASGPFAPAANSAHPYGAPAGYANASGAYPPYAPPPAPVYAAPVSMTSVPAASRLAPQRPEESGGRSVLAYVALAMVLLGVSIGAAGFVAKDRARRERVEHGPIAMPTAVPLAPMAMPTVVAAAPSTNALALQPPVAQPIPGIEPDAGGPHGQGPSRASRGATPARPMRVELAAN